MYGKWTSPASPSQVETDAIQRQCNSCTHVQPTNLTTWVIKVCGSIKLIDG